MTLPIVRDLIIISSRRTPGRDIVAEIAALYDVTVADLTGPSRRKRITHPRQHAMWEVRRRAPHLSLPQIGRLFGGRDHTTIIHGLRAHEARLAAQRGAA